MASPNPHPVDHAYQRIRHARDIIANHHADPDRQCTCTRGPWPCSVIRSCEHTIGRWTEWLSTHHPLAAPTMALPTIGDRYL